MMKSLRQKSQFVCICRFALAALLCGVMSCNQERGKSVGEVALRVDSPAVRSLIVNQRGEAIGARLKALKALLDRAEDDSAVFRQTAALLDGPLSDPNSPYRNEELFMALLQKQLTSCWLDSLNRIGPRQRLDLALQNRPGKPANDFVFYTPQGEKKTLYGTKTSHTLLYFYNPECEACIQMTAAIRASAVLDSLQRKGSLKILAIYTDADLTVWRRHLPDLPETWLHGRDNEEYLYKNRVYDLRAIPSLYLLDGGKTVLLKDVTAPAVIERLLKKP